MSPKKLKIISWILITYGSIGIVSLVLYLPSFAVIADQTDALGNIVSISYTLVMTLIPFIVGLFLLKRTTKRNDMSSEDRTKLGL